MIGENGLQNPVWFIGYVEDNSDPLNGRVRVRALGFHPPVTDNTVLTEDLPWAHVARDSKFSSIPDCGDMVVGFFMDGRDAQHPIVIGVVNSARYSAPASSGNSGGGNGATGSTTAPLVGSAANKELTPRQRAFLDAIASKESGGAYNVLNGGGTFALTGNHPNTVGPGGTSTAAGRYQFTYGTWKDISGNAPFTPENQDYYAWQLASQRYKAYTGGNLDEELSNNGVTTGLLNSLSPTWAAFGETGNQSGIIAAYNSSLAAAGGEPAQPPIEGQNPYVAPSQDVVQNYGNPALPPAFHGENIEYTAALVQSATRRTGGNYDEPGVPTPGGTATSVWHTRYGGSSIELSGKNATDESIHINHSSGSRITLDGNGNITIKSIGGKVHISSENEIEEVADGKKVAEYGSYELSVIGGVCTVTSAGDMKLSTGANLTLEAGGNITMNAGEAIDIAGATIHATARVDAVDIVAANKLALQSQGGTASITSKGATYIESSGAINVKGGGAVKVGGTEIHLNSPDSAPDSAIAAVAAAVPDAIPKTVVSDAPQPTSSSGITADMADDTGVDFANAM